MNLFEHAQEKEKSAQDIAISVMFANKERFPSAFLCWLPHNLHVWKAFENEAFKVIRIGFKHYSARTIVHFLRHHSALKERSFDGFKINNNHSPYLGRLFDLVHPDKSGLWEMRETKRSDING